MIMITFQGFVANWLEIELLLRQHIKLNQSYFLVRGKRLGKKLTEQRREPENSNHAWPGVRASGPVPHSHWWVASARY